MAIYDFLATINGVDLDIAYGFKLARVTGPWSSRAQSYPAVAIPDRDGTVRTATTPTIEPGDVVFTGSIIQATETAFETAADGLRYLLETPVLVVISGNQPDRQYTGALKGAVEIVPDQADASAGTCQFTIHCEDPNAYAVTATTASGAAATDIALPQGLRPTRGVVTVTFAGSAASLVLTYKHYDTTTLKTLTLTHAFVNTDVVAVDMRLRAITLNGARRDDLVSAGDFFAFSPRDGTPSLSHWPTLRSSVGALSTTYPKAY